MRQWLVIKFTDNSKERNDFKASFFSFYLFGAVSNSLINSLNKKKCLTYFIFEKYVYINILRILLELTLELTLSKASNSRLQYRDRRGWMDRGVQNLQPLHTPHTIITTASKILIFSVADTQLYKNLCPSVHPSVRPSVRPSVHL